MADTATIAAEPRATRGKGGARAARRAGRIPAIVYGGGGGSLAVSVGRRELLREYERGGFFSRLYELGVAGGESIRVLARDVQLHPVTDDPLHIDFLRLSADTRIDVDVAVVFINEEDSPGLRRGGVLNVVRRAVGLNCRADSIPETLVVDLADLEIGDSVHISRVALPEGAHPTIRDRDFTIATIAAPTVVADEAAEAAEAEEEEEAEEAAPATEGDDD